MKANGDYLDLPARAPSLTLLKSRLGLSDETAKTVRGLLKGDIDPCSFPRTEAYYRRCYRAPGAATLVLHAIDEVIGTYGIEGWSDPYAYRYGVAYCNTGDTYAPTVCLIHDGDGERWHLGSWGVLAEHNVCNANHA